MVTPQLAFNSSSRSFLDHLRIERGLASNSILAYARDLKGFEEFLASKKISLDDINPAVISQFEITLRKKGLSQPSISRIQSTLRSFFRHLQRESGLSDPTLEIVPSSARRRLPKALTVSQIVSMIEAAAREGDLISLRDQAILEMLYSSGARVSELIGINSGDINSSTTDNGEITTVKLRGKGGKERIVPLGSFATKAIDSYKIRTRPSLAAKSANTSSALFLNSRGGRISRQSIWQLVLTSATKVGIKERVSPHVFRHSYATHLLDGGADIRVVQELLGHSSVTTTQIYTLITIDKVRETYAISHPRARE